MYNYNPCQNNQNSGSPYGIPHGPNPSLPVPQQGHLPDQRLFLLHQKSTELKKNSNLLGLTGVVLWFFGAAAITAPRGIVTAQMAEAGGVPSEFSRVFNWILLITFYPYLWLMSTAFSSALLANGELTSMYGAFGLALTFGTAVYHRKYIKKHQNEIVQIKNLRDSLYYNSNPAFYNNNLPQNMEPQPLTQQPEMPIVADWQQLANNQNHQPQQFYPPQNNSPQSNYYPPNQTPYPNPNSQQNWDQKSWGQEKQ